jgi:hypothetical protein
MGRRRTGVEERDLAVVGFPEVLALVERVLGCCARFEVGVFGIHGYYRKV